MSHTVSSATLIAVWLVLLAAALWVAAATTSLLAWFALALIGLMPPLTWMVLSRTPARSVAEVIRDVESGR